MTTARIKVSAANWNPTPIRRMQRRAKELGVTMNVISAEHGWLKTTMRYEVDGRDEDIQALVNEFVEDLLGDVDL